MNVLTSAYKQKVVKKNYPNNQRKNMKAMKTFRKYMLRFQKLSRKIRSNFDMDTEADRIKREIEDLREEVDYIQKNLGAICDHLGIEKEGEGEDE